MLGVREGHCSLENKSNAYEVSQTKDDIEEIQRNCISYNSNAEGFATIIWRSF